VTRATSVAGSQEHGLRVGAGSLHQRSTAPAGKNHGAKAAGVYKGRPASIDVTKVREMKAQGMGASEIAKALRIGRASVYRALGERASPQ
jgi:DNA invertase Pin-like site-specific DNA recombinase